MVTFLRPRETSRRIWAFGNDATCNFSAFISQTTTAGIWYQGMLSIYFLLTTRYGMKNITIAKRIEPFMHIVAIGYPLCTAIAGAAMGIYGERAGGASCYVISYDSNDVPDAWYVQEKSSMRDGMVYIFYALPVVLVTLCLTCTQLSIYLLIRRHTRKFPSQPSEDSTSSKDDLSFGWSVLPMGTSQESSRSPRCPVVLSVQSKGKNKENSTAQSTKQSRRLRLVCSQSFLFVISFVFCNVWNFIMGIMQSRSRTQADDMGLLVKYYHFAVLQAILLPIQGLFNCLIFCRPKYLVIRLEFPREGRLWTVKRILLGDRLPQTAFRMNPGGHVANSGIPQSEPESDADAPVGDTKTSKLVPLRLLRNMISSLTASDGDCDDHANDELRSDERWHEADVQVDEGSPSDLVAGINRLTTLEAISEVSETVYDLTPYQANGSHLSASSVGLSLPTEASESRWKGTEAISRPMTTLGPPSAVESSGSDLGDVERPPSKTDSIIDVPTRKPDISDLPIQVPRRTMDVLEASNSSLSAPHLSEYSAAVVCPERLASGHDRPRGKLVFDIPLAPPQRFTSMSPSEIEDE
ncbi:unnamed protein product [Cylindrotheca closterium]|uniref:G-protein coupled receptors family 2 profile 2 domain-containing protein n=1 Tax=Cylindrotheca closterium TaxID=2856 RepID=A0AAD2CRK4_9STRA|nr:unnamed protein product [Cylindrotheca closterium]